MNALGVDDDAVRDVLQDDGAGIADAYQYDELGGGITRYKVTFDTTTTIYDVTYTRDPASGRIWTKSETIGPQSAPFSSCTAGYVYDPSTHFLEQQTGCPWAASWDYDANGNNTTYGTSFDAQDRMNVGSLGYDADGDTVSQSNGWSFLYDVPGNLRRVAAPWPSPTVDYVIDGKNRRRGFSVNGSATQGYLWDGERIVGMEKVPWGVVGHYVYATKGNVPDLMYAPQGGASWSPFRIISDPLGSVKLVVRLDAAYSPTAGGSTFFEWHDYSPWGIPVAGGGAQFGYVPFGFAGGLYDTNTGLYRYGARDYNPWVGRWWSKDPSRFGGGVNLYAYANNDPINFADPRGRNPILIGIGVEAGEMLAGAAAIGYFGGLLLDERDRLQGAADQAAASAAADQMGTIDRPFDPMSGLVPMVAAPPTTCPATASGYRDSAKPYSEDIRKCEGLGAMGTTICCIRACSEYKKKGRDVWDDCITDCYAQNGM